MSRGALPTNCFSIELSLNHRSNKNRCFYGDRDLSADFQTIFDLIRYDSLFIAHKCHLNAKPEEGKCEIYVEGWDLPPNQRESRVTFDFLMHVIYCKLSRAHLYNHFFISGDSTAPNVHTKTTVNISYPEGSLNYLYTSTENQEKVTAMGFPDDEIPDEFLCALTSQIVDIPVFDARSPEHVMDYGSMFRQLRRDGKNPFTKQYVPSEDVVYAYSLWDDIQTFMEKLEFLHEKDLSYADHMDDILDKELTAKALADKHVSGRRTPHLGELVRLVNASIEGSRNSLAIYYLGKIIASPIHNDDEAKIVAKAKIHNVLLHFEKGHLEKAFELFENIPTLSVSDIDEAYAAMLVAVAKYHLDREEYPRAQSLLDRADAILARSDLPQVAFHVEHKEVNEKARRLKLLCDLKCKDDYNGHSKAVRRAVASGTVQQLQQCFDLLHATGAEADHNPKQGYVAMHWAIKRNRLEHAWMLCLRGCPMESRTMRWTDDKGVQQGGETCIDMMNASKNKRFQKLLLPNMRLKLNIAGDLNDGDAAELINKHIDGLKKVLGFDNDATDLVYISTIRTLVVANFHIDSDMRNQFVVFFNRQVSAIPELANSVSIKSTSALVDQEPPGEDRDTTFVFKFRPNVVFQSGAGSASGGANSSALFQSDSTEIQFFNKNISGHLVDAIRRAGLFPKGRATASTTYHVQERKVEFKIPTRISQSHVKFLMDYVAATMGFADVITFTGITLSGTPDTRPLTVVTTTTTTSPAV